MLLLCALFFLNTGTVLAADDGGMGAGLFGLMLFTGIMCMIIPIILLVIRILVLIWVYKDAKSRGMNAVVWLLIAFFLGIIGLIVFLIVRRSHPKKM
jgi:uncharacterized membrane protein YhdT